MILDFLAPSIRHVNYPWGGLLAQAAEAKGAKINATLGVLLDDELRIGIVPAVSERVSLERNQITEYAPSHGVLPLRQLWRKRLQDLGHVDPATEAQVSLPIVTAGLTAGLSLAGQLVLEPGGSELVLSSPCWPNYELMFQDIQRAKLRSFSMFTSGGAQAQPSQRVTGSANLPELALALAQSHDSVQPDRPVVLLLNAPHNPTGYSYTTAECAEMCTLLQSFLRIAPKRRLVVIIDDAYSGFVYEPDARKQSLLRELGNLDERLLAIHISGATKELYAWGLRVGFVTFAGKGLSKEDLKTLEDKAAALVRGSVSNVAMVAQHLCMETLRDPRTDATHKHYESMMRTRYTACKKELERSDVQAHFEPLPFNSGYFFALRLRDPRLHAETLRKALLERHAAGVITIGHDLIRIAFSAITEGQVRILFDALVSTATSLTQNNS